MTTTREFDFQRGRTDIVGVARGDKVVSFEAKLTRWKDALDQAYRNTSFSHLSFVLLPMPVALRAKEHADQFDMRKVGICSVSKASVVVVHPAAKVIPILPWLCEKVIGTINGSAKCRSSSSTK
jgi:hypothetical protein